MSNHTDAIAALLAGFVFATLAQLPPIIEANHLKAARDAAYATEYAK